MATPPTADRLPFAAESLLAQLLERFSANDALARLDATAFAAGQRAGASLPNATETADAN